MDHKTLLVQITARIDRLEDRLADRLDGVAEKIEDHAYRLNKVESNSAWIMRIGTALIAGAWTAIITIYKTL